MSAILAADMVDLERNHGSTILPRRRAGRQPVTGERRIELMFPFGLS